MAGDWRTVTLGNVLGKSGYIRGPFGSALKRGELLSAGIPVYEQQHAIYNDRTFRFYVDEQKAKALVRFTTKPGDLLISCSGTLGRVSLINEDDPQGIISQALLLLRPDTSIIHPKYLYYFLASPRGFHSLVSVSSGSVQVNIAKRGIVEQIELPLPPLPEQKAIAGVLGTLDDKIELNRRMNATLEAMAQALFKSWFVDFDPVRARSEGRAPAGLDEATAALFPSEFQDSPLGPIPKGWRSAAVSDVCESIFSGGTPSTQNANYWGGTIPWLSSGETRAHFIIGTEKTISGTGVANSSTRLARKGCTVIAAAGQGHTRGQTSLLAFDSYINQSVLGLAANQDILSDLFLFFDMERRYDQLRQLSDSHSSRGSLTTKLIGGVQMVVPPKQLVTQFDAVVEPIIARIVSNLHQAKGLTTLRDTLLPKLLSGELPVTSASEYCDAAL